MRRTAFARSSRRRPAAETRAMREYRAKHFACEACRMIQPSQTHHIVSETTGGPSEDWNFLALCYGCHIHGFHGQGWQTFCAAWPHLAGKITVARIKMGRRTR